MTIKELKELVMNIPTEYDLCPVLLQLDQAGNGYREIRGVDYNAASDLSSGYPEKVISLDDTPDDNLMEPEEQDVWAKKHRCAVIYP